MSEHGAERNEAAYKGTLYQIMQVLFRETIKNGIAWIGEENICFVYK